MPNDKIVTLFPAKTNEGEQLFPLFPGTSVIKEMGFGNLWVKFKFDDKFVEGVVVRKSARYALVIGFFPEFGREQHVLKLADCETIDSNTIQNVGLEGLRCIAPLPASPDGEMTCRINDVIVEEEASRKITVAVSPDWGPGFLEEFGLDEIRIIPE